MSSPTQIENLFLAALEKPTPEERDAFLAGACAEEPELRERVRRLLEAHGRLGDFLERPAAEPEPTADPAPSAPSPAPDSIVGQLIGRYKLLELIGEGGMGLVYMAEQQVPVRRRVAVKVIKPGMDSRQILARFEAERQALALMDHPNIARVFDAGETADGRPYFVMELVPGVPITDYCDGNQLAIPQRLELFIQVCRAVQHAHQKGIIHRDLKPSNVLVTRQDGRGVPKVIDFGVAKATSQPLTDKTLFTRFGQVIGTPLYMSPEQLELTNLDVDTRSDVYSLGVLLYELLTGTTPFAREALAGAAFLEMSRMIREDDPPRPSMRIGTLGAARTSVAALRQVDPRHLGRIVRGDLDWIVMRALDKDRARRYDTATGMARDIERYLAEEPVEARPPSFAYRARKYARKHRAFVSAACLVTIALVLGTVVSTWQAIRATRAEEAAVVARDAATRLRAEEQLATRQARKNGERAERLLYASQMRLASEYWDSEETFQLWSALRDCDPKFRGWEHDYLFSRLTDDRVLFERPAHRVAFAPDGQSIYVSEYDKGVKQLDARTGVVLRHLPGSEGQYFDIDVSQDGRRLVGLVSNGELRVWNTVTANLVRASRREGARVLALSPDGRRVAVSGRGNPAANGESLVVQDTDIGEDLLTLIQETESVGCVEYSPDGSRIAGGSKNDIVRIWDAETGGETRALGDSSRAAHSIAFHPGGEWIATRRLDEGVQIWNTGNGELEESLDRVSRAYGGLEFSPNGRQLAAQTENGIEIFDCRSWDRLAFHWNQLDMLPDLAYSPDSRHLASADDVRLCVWETENLWSRVEFAQKPRRSAGQVWFTPDVQRLVTNMDDEAAVWDVQTGKRLRTLPTEAVRLTLSPDGQRIATAARDGKARVWDTQSGDLLFTLHGDATEGYGEIGYSPDGRFIFFRSGTTWLWDAVSGQQVLVLGSDPLECFAFSPDSRSMLLGSMAAITKLDIATGKVDWKLAIDDSPRALAFSPNGDVFAAAQDQTIAIHRERDGSLVQAFRCYDNDVTCLAFSPDGWRLASASGVQGVRLWDHQVGQLIFTFFPAEGWNDAARGGGPVRWITFSPDGRTIATTADKVGVELWEAPRRMQEAESAATESDQDR